MLQHVKWSLPLMLITLSPAVSQMPLGSPLDGLEQLKEFQTMRVSSCDPNWQNGNADNRPINPGETRTLAEIEGPGKITHIWFTIAHDVPFYSRLLTLRIYWDGETHPSVECPIGDFFGIGHGVDQPFVSLPIKVSSDGRARNCYWPMPFRKSARITVSNDSEVRCNAIFYYIDWQKHRELPDDVAYFHAMYRQEHPCVMGRNYLLADIAGRGHYVGTIQSVYHISPGWYGEGDDFFFIDGETEPSLRGTGTEDYFCDAWGFREQDGPFYGTPLWEGYAAGDRGTAYRFHITDPVTFKTSLRVEIEHKGSQHFDDGEVSGFIERDDLMSSVALWYQVEPHKPWGPLPAGPERLPFREESLVVGYREVDNAKHSAHPLEIQPIAGASDGKQLWFKPHNDEGWVGSRLRIRDGADRRAMGQDDSFLGLWNLPRIAGWTRAGRHGSIPSYCEADTAPLGQTRIGSGIACFAVRVCRKVERIGWLFDGVRCVVGPDSSLPAAARIRSTQGQIEVAQSKKAEVPGPDPSRWRLEFFVPAGILKERRRLGCGRSRCAMIEIPVG
jgi:hypothetical protein